MNVAIAIVVYLLLAVVQGADGSYTHTSVAQADAGVNPFESFAAGSE
jgi:hypothetical protein